MSRLSGDLESCGVRWRLTRSVFLGSAVPSSFQSDSMFERDGLPAWFEQDTGAPYPPPSTARPPDPAPLLLLKRINRNQSLTRADWSLIAPASIDTPYWRPVTVRSYRLAAPLPRPTSLPFTSSARRRLPLTTQAGRTSQATGETTTATPKRHPPQKTQSFSMSQSPRYFSLCINVSLSPDISHRLSMFQSLPMSLSMSQCFSIPQSFSACLNVLTSPKVSQCVSMFQRRPITSQCFLNVSSMFRPEPTSHQDWAPDFRKQRALL